jgi:hypothetical protein
MKLSRTPRKQMRLSEAADLLQVSRTTIRKLIYEERKLQVASQRKPGTTSPIKVYQKQVEELAQEWGIL